MLKVWRSTNTRKYIGSL